VVIVVREAVHEVKEEGVVRKGVKEERKNPKK